MKKYELTLETTLQETYKKGRKYETLYRIRALRDFGNVNKGDLGGFIRSERNLSHKKDCWVSGDARVFGSAKVFGYSWVYGTAWVYAHAMVFGNARVGDNAMIGGHVLVYGNASIYNNAKILENAQVCGDTDIGGEALIHRYMYISGRNTIDYE